MFVVPRYFTKGEGWIFSKFLHFYLHYLSNWKGKLSSLPPQPAVLWLPGVLSPLGSPLLLPLAFTHLLTSPPRSQPFCHRGLPHFLPDTRLPTTHPSKHASASCKMPSAFPHDLPAHLQTPLLRRSALLPVSADLRLGPRMAFLSSAVYCLSDSLTYFSLSPCLNLPLCPFCV